jgi:hypothetical protein
MTHKIPPWLLLTLLVTSGTVTAGACTYREALMALQQGNATRGLALMKMASRDGDVRATRYLATMTKSPRQSQTASRTWAGTAMVARAP